MSDTHTQASSISTRIRIEVFSGYQPHYISNARPGLFITGRIGYQPHTSAIECIGYQPHGCIVYQAHGCIADQPHGCNSIANAITITNTIIVNDRI